MGFSLTNEFIIKYGFDELSILFAILTAVMYILIGVYQVEYFRGDKHVVPYNVFYVLSFFAMMSLIFSKNLITMYISFEMVSLSTAMLVFHERTKESRTGAYRILFYSIAGAFTALAGVFMIYTFVDGDVPFTKGGFITQTIWFEHGDELLVASALMIIGFGVKAAILPFQSWLPAAHPVAPAPGSAALSGIVVNCGIFAVIRSVFYVLGRQYIMNTWVQTVWMLLSIVTIFLGSMLAYKEKGLKKRLAYSTISQMNYAMFGLSMLSVAGVMGAIIQTVFHSMVKITLFLVAGALIHYTGKKMVDEYDGIGKRMPVTMICYTIASIALVGIPPSGNFIAKWYLSMGAITDLFNKTIAFIGMIVLMISALLTAGYLFPLFIRGFFPKDKNLDIANKEPSKWMVIPLVILALMIVILGIYSEPIIDAAQKIVEQIM